MIEYDFLEVMQVTLSKIQTYSNFTVCKIVLRNVACYIWSIKTIKGNCSQIRD